MGRQKKLKSVRLRKTPKFIVEKFKQECGYVFNTESDEEIDSIADYLPIEKRVKTTLVYVGGKGTNVEMSRDHQARISAVIETLEKIKRERGDMFDRCN